MNDHTPTAIHESALMEHAHVATSTRRGYGSLLNNGLRIALLLALAAFMLVPIIWMLIAPSKTNNDLLSIGVSLVPGPLTNVGRTWSNLTGYQSDEIAAWLVNSIEYTLGSLVLSLVLCVPAGYALATWRFAGRSIVLILTLITMITPGTALVLPLFQEVNAVHLINTPWAVILPAAFYPFGAYLTFIFFTTSLPKDLLAAARIDGCSEFGVFRFVALPLSRPIFALVAFFSFVANWNNYFLPFVMLTDDRKYPLPVGLTNLINSSGAITAIASQGFSPIKRPEAALAGLIVIVPVVIIFLFSQRFVQAGMLVGAEKG